MAIRFDDLPEVDEGRVKALLQPRPSRRGVIRGLAVGGMSLALGGFAVLNSGVKRAEAAYFQDWTDVTSGPCGPGNYASGHTEAGLKCGPSPMCTDQSCCWKYRSGADNMVGWHKQAPGRGSTYYLHRPDECWASYDSWRWRFSDGKTYRCSDGFTCNSSSCYRSICPWAV
ncbi:hypothetical protein ACQP1U_05895 [Actinomycetota bacterium]